MDENIIPDYAARRRRLLDRMGQGIAILPTANPKVRSGDVHYPYRPDSDFFYLTGFAEPEAVLVLLPGHPEGETNLFCRPKDPAREVWEGRRAGLEGAKARCGVDRVHSIHEINEILPGLMEDQEILFYSVGRDADFDARVMHWLNQARAKVRQGVRAPREIVDVDELIHEMRLRKDPAEVAFLRRAVGISGAAHRQAMRVCRPGMYEYELAAEIEHVFRRLGASGPAYPTIVGGEVNACILHYTENDMALPDGGLVLIDAGAEYGNYAGDITRTLPVSGRYSPEQKAIYELVLSAQEAAIRALKPGTPVNAYHEAATRVLTQGLIDLGLLKGGLEECLEKEGYKTFYMHRTGHWLGMDVHDVGRYRVSKEAWRVLEPGMVLTVEPGLYINPDNAEVPENFRGIAVRIEDDALITADGCEILSADVPKDVEAVEAAMAGG